MTRSLSTERLVLRQWKKGDAGPFARMNADRLVMAFFMSTLTRRESDAMMIYQSLQISRRGWGVWAVERKSDMAFMGSVGLHIPRTALPFSPCVEVGWRLLPEYWGQGYASEAARESLRFGFEVLNLPEIVSFTARVNERSQAVMKRLGMKDTGEIFMHPSVPRGHLLREHCLYRMTKREWAAGAGAAKNAA